MIHVIPTPKKNEMSESRVELFARALEKQWMAENKPQGFDCQDIRFGGMLRRLEYCKRTLNDYLDLKINTIPELEEEIIKIYDGKLQFNSWRDIVTTNCIN